MKIIGHRGAAGLAPENTIKAIKAGIAAGADAVEFDIRRTKDDAFVVSHDFNLLRLAGLPDRISSLNLKQLRAVKFSSGEPIASLEEALGASMGALAVIEPKGNNWASALVDNFSNLPDIDRIRVISFNHPELLKFHELLPTIPCYMLERQHVFKAIQMAKKAGLRGVNLKFILLNPFTYWYARLNKLDIIIYTVDNPLLMRWFTWLYPNVAITTNRPDILSKIKKR